MVEPRVMLAALALALVLDALFGEPDALYRRVPHPAVVIGRTVAALERRRRRPFDPPEAQQRAGRRTTLVVVGAAAAVGLAAQLVCAALPLGWVVEGALLSTLLAQRSLYDHVVRVARGLERSLGDGRAAVALIVGRDPDSLDRAGVARAAIESTAENFADGVAAPVFWALLLGLPGALAYKAVNTLDSMIGHKNAAHLHFGRFAARLDDAANLVPARLAGLLLVAAAALLPDASAGRAFRALRRDAGKHRSPNAGWPEAAAAGALGLRLAGPRRYGGAVVEDAWMGDGRAEAGPTDIREALRLLVVACGLVWALVLGAWLASA